ncbi:c-type cytochrome [Ralstonia solanacearum]|uniref:c-type cytochrome n=1 Tax=Ralstonia solanacearum TaxID=305 RepID=UPI002029E8AD|nr:c-type cytochrome [Ralstonia solanacearum]MCL9845829.1 cytochrome c [Ralstonia solanacearum]MDC6254764.1 cytochrome c [Ralstonia solanacearum]MDC6260586.1 cytochrome c [Ralstonia solanacearum]MDC6305705.1 cytochrome c [Ralstonia solanacearum]
MPVAHRLAAAASLAVPSVVHAADAPPSNAQARTWAASCASCHHADTAPGAKTAAPTLAPLAGRPQAELIATLQAFRNGTRPSTVMGQLMRGYDDAQIAAIAGWLSRQPQETP